MRKNELLFTSALSALLIFSPLTAHASNTNDQEVSEVQFVNTLKENSREDALTFENLSEEDQEAVLDIINDPSLLFNEDGTIKDEYVVEHVDDYQIEQGPMPVARTVTREKSSSAVVNVKGVTLTKLTTLMRYDSRGSKVVALKKKTGYVEKNYIPVVAPKVLDIDGGISNNTAWAKTRFAWDSIGWNDIRIRYGVATIGVYGKANRISWGTFKKS